MAKIAGDNLEILRKQVSPLDTQDERERYMSGDFPRADAVKDLNMRYRWDLLWASGGLPSELRELDLKDAHIDTALRSIVPELEA